MLCNEVNELKNDFYVKFTTSGIENFLKKVKKIYVNKDLYNLKSISFFLHGPD